MGGWLENFIKSNINVLGFPRVVGVRVRPTEGRAVLRTVKQSHIVKIKSDLDIIPITVKTSHFCYEVGYMEDDGIIYKIYTHGFPVEEGLVRHMLCMGWGKKKYI